MDESYRAVGAQRKQIVGKTGVRHTDKYCLGPLSERVLLQLPADLKGDCRGEEGDLAQDEGGCYLGSRGCVRACVQAMRRVGGETEAKNSITG